jgi:hypothetical protein
LLGAVQRPWERPEPWERRPWERPEPWPWHWGEPRQRRTAWQ